MGVNQPNYVNLNKELKLVEDSLRLPACSDENRHLVQNVLEALMVEMKKKCPMFQHLYQEITYQGSYFDGLRIKEATEFDLNIVLSFSKNLKLKLKVVSDDKPQGFAKVQLEKPLTEYNLTKEVNDKIKGFFDAKHFLLPDKINQFMESTLSRTNCSTIKVDGVRKIETSSSGPARTLKIHTNNGQRIDLDLVPVLRFDGQDFPKSLTLPAGVKFEATDKVWYMVPKKYKSGLKNNPREPKADDIPRLWRMHFPNLEKRIMKDIKCVKPIIKILKSLRDEQNWSSIASYYLKTVVLHEVIRNNNKEYWNDVKMAERFLDVLLKLKTYTEKMCLPYLMFPSFNLFCCINPLELANIQCRIAVIHKRVIDNPEKILEFCGVRRSG